MLTTVDPVIDIYFDNMVISNFPYIRFIRGFIPYSDEIKTIKFSYYSSEPVDFEDIRNTLKPFIEVICSGLHRVFRSHMSEYDFYMPCLIFGRDAHLVEIQVSMVKKTNE